MSHYTPRAALSALAAVACLAATGVAQAVSVYTYTGNPYNVLTGNTANGFTTADQLTLSFSTTSPLLASHTYPFAANFGLADLLGWTADDGPHTLGPGSPNGLLQGTLTTNAAGDIVAWSINVQSYGPPNPSYTFNTCGAAPCLSSVGVSGMYAGEYNQVNPTLSSGYYAGIATTPGTWVTTSPVPEPGSWAMLAAGLLVVSRLRGLRRP
jgi:hypothetical protein